MADKQVEIEVVTKTDITEVEDLQTALEETEASAEKVAESLENVGDPNVEKISSDFDEVGKSADEASEEVDKFQNSLDLIDSAALLGISKELDQIGSKAEGMAQDMNTAAISVGQLATQTGIAEPQMVSLINSISNATFPNDEAMMYVKSLDQMGVASENFAASATNLDRINDAFGLGAQTTNSLGQELGVLGVDMNNVSASFNALAYANANTVGGMDNYFSFLKRYDAQFNELGYDVDQASIIIAAATQKYGGGRAALSGLSSALKEADGDTRKLEEALGIQAGTLDNASAVTGQYEGQLEKLAKEEAEHKTIIDQLGAAWEDVSLSMSPVMAPMASIMGLIGNAGSFAVGINGLVTLANSMRGLSLVTYAKAAADGVAAAAQWALNLAMSANPIGLVIIAIVALIAVLGYLYFNNEQVRNAINALGQALIWIARVIVGTATNAVSNFTSTIASLPARLSSELNQMLSAVNKWASTLPQKFWDAGVNAVRNFLAALGIASPGTMQRMLVWEISEMGRRTPVEGRKLLTNISSLGSDIVDEFGNPTLGIGFETMNNNLTGGNGNGYGQVINLNVEVGSVDSEDRVQEIVDVIRRELAWNNTTAGRSV